MEPQPSSKYKIKREYWVQQISNWKASGLNQKQFCQSQSIALSTFCYWKRKAKEPESSAPRFYPLAIPSSYETFSDTGLLLLVGNKRFQVELKENFSRTALQKLIAVLEKL